MKSVVKSVCFLLIFGLFFCRVQEVVKQPDHDIDSYKYMTGFYGIPDGTLDAVYIGSSMGYLFFCPSWAWEHYGIAVYPFASGGQPLSAARYLIEEARKKQPDALYIINVPPGLSAGTGIDINTYHLLSDYIPLSRNKVKLVWNAGELGGYSVSERLEYLLPIIRYHSRWKGLKEDDYEDVRDEFKGNVFPSFLNTRIDYSSSYTPSCSDRGSLTDLQIKCITELFEYCSSNQVRCLFVISPIIVTNESVLANLNVFCDMCETEGYPVINMLENWKDVKIDRAYDYLNETHVNIHGAIKTTDYLLRYLDAHYPFTDKRGNDAYKEWDESYELYTEFISPYVLDIEWNGEPRDVTLSAPEITAIKTDENKFVLKWEKVTGADGYAVYRKKGNDCWEQIGITDENELELEDKDENTQIKYTVIAFKDTNGTRYWGFYNVDGLLIGE